MRRPRCGVPDLTPEDLTGRARKKRYTLTGRQWAKDHITYRSHTLSQRNKARVKQKRSHSRPDMSFLFSYQHNESEHPLFSGRGADIWCDPQGLWRMEASDAAHLWGATCWKQHQWQPSGAQWHPHAVCLWFPWWYVFVWWGRWVIGPCLLSRTRNRWGYTLRRRWAMDTRRRKLKGSVASFSFTFFLCVWLHLLWSKVLQLETATNENLQIQHSWGKCERTQAIKCVFVSSFHVIFTQITSFESELFNTVCSCFVSTHSSCRYRSLPGCGSWARTCSGSGAFRQPQCHNVSRLPVDSYTKLHTAWGWHQRNSVHIWWEEHIFHPLAVE